MLAPASLALVAAFLFALASVLQQRAASTVPDEDALRASLVVRLVRQPLWLAGFACDGAGYAVQAAALALGSLVVVQPLLVTMLLFALPLGARVSGRRLSSTDWRWAVALTTCLVVFLVLGDPTAGVDQAAGRTWAASLVVIYPLAAIAVGSARRRRGAPRALLLGAAAGLLYGTTDALTKTVVRGLGDGVVSTLTTWETWALVVTICAGAFLQQSSYQAGGLAASLPAITSLEPLTGTLLGLLVYQERFQTRGPATAAALVVAATGAVIATIALARSAGRVGTQSDPPAAPRPPPS